jgi:hypothetical protein
MSVANVSDQPWTWRLTALGCFVHGLLAMVALVYVVALDVRLQTRAQSLRVETLAPSAVPGARLAVPFAVAAALLASAGTVTSAVRTGAAPSGLALTASELDAVVAANAPVPTAVANASYVLTTPTFSIRTMGRPTRTVEHNKLAGGSATTTTWEVSGAFPVQIVTTVTLSSGVTFTKSARVLLQDIAARGHLALTRLRAGRLGGHLYWQAILTDNHGSTFGVRSIILGRTFVTILAQIDDLAGLVSSMALR